MLFTINQSPTVLLPVQLQAIKLNMNIGCRGCALMLSLHKLTGTDRQVGRQAQVSIGMHAHPKTCTM